MEEQLLRLLYGKREAAVALGISVRTLETLLSLKELRSVRVGRRRLISIKELERFMRGDHSTRSIENSEIPNG
jgi:excisionase family DNA binding protein